MSTTKKKTVNFPEVKMKRGEILQRAKMLEKPLGLNGLRLCWALDRNRIKLTDLANSLMLDVVCPKSDRRKEYDKKEQELFKESSKKADGTFKTKKIETPNGPMEVYDIAENEEKFAIALNKLKKEYDKELEEYNQQTEEYYEKFLQEQYPDSLDIRFVPLCDLPENISDVQMNAISFMVMQLSKEQEEKLNQLWNEFAG